MLKTIRLLSSVFVSGLVKNSLPNCEISNTPTET